FYPEMSKRVQPMARTSQDAAVCDEGLCMHQGSWQRRKVGYGRGLPIFFSSQKTAATNTNPTLNLLSKELVAETDGDGEEEMRDSAPCDFEETWAWISPAKPHSPQPLPHPTEPTDAPQCP
ncbi:unnamed protein product, partial [Bubo scandiacus]